MFEKEKNEIIRAILEGKSLENIDFFLKSKCFVKNAQLKGYIIKTIPPQREFTITLVSPEKETEEIILTVAIKNSKALFPKIRAVS